MSDEAQKNEENPLPANCRLDTEIRCIERELGKRRSVYPKWVAEGKMKQIDAEREIAAMNSVLNTLQWLRALSQLPINIKTRPLQLRQKQLPR